jgi:filamentous hemagglutinin
MLAENGAGGASASSSGGTEGQSSTGRTPQVMRLTPLQARIARAIADCFPYVAAGLNILEGSGLFGERGVQFSSKTFWTNGKSRIDAENPNPGQRSGQIHYQEGDKKFLYDPKTKTFTGAGRALNRALVRNPAVRQAIDKALKYMGEL